MPGPVKLTEDDINDFAEVGNIGAGNAAACLSELIDRKCLIDLPKVDYLSLQGIRDVFAIQDCLAVALHIQIMGDIPSVMCVMTDRAHALKIVEYMLKTAPSESDKDISFMAQFALKQMGEALTRAFSASIIKFLLTKARYAMPEIIIDSWSTALDLILDRIGPPEAMQLVIHTGFYDEEKTFQGKCLYILSPEAQDMVLKRFQLLLKRPYSL